jgi:hypothetical protein
LFTLASSEVNGTASSFRAKRTPSGDDYIATVTDGALPDGNAHVTAARGLGVAR